MGSVSLALLNYETPVSASTHWPASISPPGPSNTMYQWANVQCMHDSDCCIFVASLFQLATCRRDVRHVSKQTFIACMILNCCIFDCIFCRTCCLQDVMTAYARQCKWHIRCAGSSLRATMQTSSRSTRHARKRPSDRAGTESPQTGSRVSYASVPTKLVENMGQRVYRY
jgi:hypothetical protein